MIRTSTCIVVILIIHYVFLYMSYNYSLRSFELIQIGMDFFVLRIYCGIVLAQMSIWQSLLDFHKYIIPIDSLMLVFTIPSLVIDYLHTLIDEVLTSNSCLKSCQRCIYGYPHSTILSYCLKYLYIYIDQTSSLNHCILTRCQRRWKLSIDMCTFDLSLIHIWQQ